MSDPTEYVPLLPEDMMYVDVRLVLRKDADPRVIVERLRSRDVPVMGACFLRDGAPDLNMSTVYTQSVPEILAILDYFQGDRPNPELPPHVRSE